MTKTNFVVISSSQNDNQRRLPIGVKRIPESVDKKQRKRRRKSGAKILGEIRKLQNSTNTLIPRVAFQRVVKKIARKNMFDTRWTPDALAALQVLV